MFYTDLLYIQVRETKRTRGSQETESKSKCKQVYYNVTCKQNRVSYIFIVGLFT